MEEGCCCAGQAPNYEPAQVCAEKIPKARKPHLCCECAGTIEPGDHYHVFTILYDDRWNRWTMCRRCKAIGNEYLPCGYALGDMWNELAYCLMEDGETEHDLAGWLYPDSLVRARGLAT